MREGVKMGFSFLRRIGNLSGPVYASGGLLFPRGKSHQKRAKTKVLESFFGRHAGLPVGRYLSLESSLRLRRCR